MTYIHLIQWVTKSMFLGVHVERQGRYSHKQGYVHSRPFKLKKSSLAVKKTLSYAIDIHQHPLSIRALVLHYNRHVALVIVMFCMSA